MALKAVLSFLSGHVEGFCLGFLWSLRFFKVVPRVLQAFKGSSYGSFKGFLNAFIGV